MAGEQAELDLLRRVALAAEWAIRSNADHPVDEDGRAVIGVNHVASNAALAKALADYRAAFQLPPSPYAAAEAEAKRMDAAFGEAVRRDGADEGAAPGAP